MTPKIDTLINDYYIMYTFRLHAPKYFERCDYLNISM